MNVYLGPSQSLLKNAYIGEYRAPGSNTLVYLPIKDSDSSSIVYDNSGNNNNFNWYGTASYDNTSAGKRVLNLTGSNGIYIDYALFTSNPFTVNLYIYRYGNQNNDATAFQNQRGTPKNGLVMAFFESTKITSFVGDNSNWQGLNNRESLSNTTWNNVVTTYDNGTIKMYINGVLKQSYSATATFNNLLSASFGFTRNIGDYSNTRFFTGKMGSLIVENKTWTAEEVSEYYNLTKSKYGL